MKPYYEVSHIKLFNKDCCDMSELPDESVDMIVTDPPYQLSTIDRFKKPDSGEKWNVKSGIYHRIDKGFMGKEWDVLPPVEVWRESLRVLKPGAFAFIMTTPRQDSLCQILSDLTNAGFQMGFSSIYWTYASGFPKAQNIGKAVDKRLGAEREVIGQKIRGDVEKAKQSGSTFAVADANKNNKDIFGYGIEDLTKPATPQAKALDGSYGGFQPKPAVEVILVCMKPLSEKTFVDQALKNRKGITWLDDCRIPYESKGDLALQQDRFKGHKNPKSHSAKSLFTDIKDHSLNLVNPSGRFPANLICSDDVLNDGVERKSGGSTTEGAKNNWGDDRVIYNPMKGNSGSFSRYFDLDKWAQKTFPFLIAPKASKSEKSKGCEEMYWLNGKQIDSRLYYKLKEENNNLPQNKKHQLALANIHPTCKPLKLMSYLITLGSREGDVVLDNFGGSGTTGVAAKLLGRKCIMYEIDEQYCQMAANRCRQMVLGL